MPNLTDAHQRHAAHYANVLHKANVLYSGEDPIKGLILYREEFINIQRAMEWAAVHSGELEYARYLCVMFPAVGAGLLDKYQHPLERIQLLETAVEFAADFSWTVAQDRLLIALGRAYVSAGKTREAVGLFEKSLSLAEAAGDKGRELSAVSNLGVAYFHLGQFIKAIECEQRALDLARAVGDRGAEAQTLGDLGNVYYLLENYDRAAELYEERLRIADELHDADNKSGALLSLGLVYMKQGRWDDAVEAYQQALSASRQLGDLRAEGEILGNLSSLYGVLGETDKSFEISDRRLEIARETGDPRGEGKALYNRAVIERDYGDNEVAISLAEDALVILEPSGDAFVEKMKIELEEWRKGLPKRVSAFPEVDELINRRLKLSSEYQKQLDEWQSLPWWRRILTKRPTLPRDLLYGPANMGRSTTK